MAMPVSLARLLSALQFAAPGAGVCVDTVMGEVIEAIETPRVIDQSSDRSAPLDSSQDSERFQTISLDFDEREIAKRFCETIADRDNRRRLETALMSAQPLESFENALYRVGIAHQWFPFRERQLGDLAKAWLETAGIPFVDDLT
jgi:hypothetical protein